LPELVLIWDCRAGDWEGAADTLERFFNEAVAGELRKAVEHAFLTPLAL